jgi:patatin-like phospholipase/acyl hydrolase
MPADKLGFLALDGDGARNFSSLIILQQIMAAVNPENPPKPCEFFDLIGGTGMGG